MKKIFAAAVSLSFVFFISCKNGDAHPADTLKAQADSLYNQLLKGHNEGMNGWMKIEDKQKEIQKILDSATKLPPSYKEKLNEAATELKNAYEKMDTWMSSMNLDSAANDLKQRIEYLTGEKLKATEITKQINHSLQKADSVLKAIF